MNARITDRHETTTTARSFIAVNPQMTIGKLGLLPLVLYLTYSVYGQNEDSCDLITSFIYCRCEQLILRCYIHGHLKPGDPIWNEFDQKVNITELAFVSRSGFELNFIPVSAIVAIPGLKVLQFQQAKLGIIPPHSFSENKLSKIDLKSNEITQLQSGSFSSMRELKRLSLTGNLLKEIKKGTFVDLPRLEDLFLDDNNISAIEGRSFDQLSSLRELDLSRNFLLEIEEETFSGLSNLDILDLYRNQIQELKEGVFRHLIRLRQLNLNNNVISRIHPHALDGLSNLNSLLLNYNQLKTLPEGLFLPTTELRQISLSSNKLQILPANVLELKRKWDSNFVFHFKDNELKCDCKLWWLIHYSVNNSESSMWKKEIRHVKCLHESSTEHNDSQRVIKLRQEEVGCEDDPIFRKNGGYFLSENKGFSENSNMESVSDTSDNLTRDDSEAVNSGRTENSITKASVESRTKSSNKACSNRTANIWLIALFLLLMVF